MTRQAGEKSGSSGMKVNYTSIRFRSIHGHSLILMTDVRKVQHTTQKCCKTKHRWPIPMWCVTQSTGRAHVKLKQEIKSTILSPLSNLRSSAVLLNKVHYFMHPFRGPENRKCTVANKLRTISSQVLVRRVGKDFWALLYGA